MDRRVHCQLKQFDIMESEFLFSFVQLIAFKDVMGICLI